MLSPILVALGMQGADLGLVEAVAAPEPAPEPDPATTPAKGAAVRWPIRVERAERQRALALCSGQSPTPHELVYIKIRAKGHTQPDTRILDPETGLDPRAVAVGLTVAQAQATLDTVALFAAFGAL